MPPSVGAYTRSSIGAYTAFLVRPVDRSNTRELFYVRNDDVSMAMERGAIVGLLMGAAQANRWVTEGPRRAVDIEYVTIDGRKEIVAAALGITLPPTN
jgi:hypothetical protein